MPFLTAKDVSVELSIPLARVYELTRRRKIPAVILGKRQIRYDPVALSAWAERGGVLQTDREDERQSEGAP